MNKDFIKKLSDIIDDPEITETIERISDNIDRVERMKQQRHHPDGTKVRVLDILASLDPTMKSRAEKASGQLGLVLTGGGGKGSYQVGVLKALQEAGILIPSGFATGTSVKQNPTTVKADSSVTADSTPAKTDLSAVPESTTVKTDSSALPGSAASKSLELPLHITGVAGTSAGALNAALIAGGDALMAEAVWSSLDESRIQGQDGFFSPSEENDRYLEDLIRNSNILPKITTDSLLTIVTAFDYERAYPKDFLLNTMNDEEKVHCLLASSAFPIAFKERIIKGIKYIDGGIPLLGSNMPVAPLYYLGFRKFIVVHCYSQAEGSRFAFLDKLNLKVNQEEHYNGAAFLHIFPSRNLGGLFEGTINFNHDYITQNMALGYKDMKNVMKDLSIFSESVGDYDEVHMVKGDRYRSFIEVLERR